MIYLGTKKVTEIFIGNKKDPDIYIGDFKTYPNGVVNKWVSLETGKFGITYHNGGSYITASGGSGDYAVFWGTVCTEIDGVRQPDQRIEFTPVPWNNGSTDISMWHISGTHIWADNRGTTTGSSRSMNVTAYYDLNGDGTPEEYPLYVTVTQEANSRLYRAGAIQYIYFDGSRYIVYGSTVNLDNIGSKSGSYDISATGYRDYRYTSWGADGWREMSLDNSDFTWTLTEGSSFASLYKSGSEVALNIERNQSTTSSRRVSFTVEDPMYSSTRVTGTTLQSADNFTFKLYDGTPNPYMVEYNDTTTYVYVVSKQGSSRSAIALGNITITSNGARLTASTVTDYSSYSGEGVYRLTFAGAVNSSSYSDRTSTIRVTQPASSKQITFDIKQAIQGQFHNGMEIVSSYTLNNEVWDFGTVLLADGNRAMMIIKRNNTPVSADVKVNVNDVRWTTPVGTDREYNTSFMISSGSSISFPTYYEGNKTYYGAVFMNESEFYDMENLTVTMCDMSLEDGDAITNIHVEYWSGNTQLQESYIPAAGGNSTFAIVRGQRGNETVVLDVAFASGTDTSVWSIENQYMRIHAASRGTVTGTTRTATVNVSYRGRDFGTQTITQQANSKSNYVSAGEIDWVRVNNDVIYSGGTVSIDNFATTLQLTQVHGYRKQYYTSGAYDTVSMGYNDYTVSVEYGERSWINTGSTKNYIEVSANTSQISSRDAVVTVADVNGYNPNPSLTFTVEQAADSWIFSVDTPSVTLGYNQTAFTIYITSKHSGSAYDISAESNWATTLVTYPNGNAIGATAKTITCTSSINGQYGIYFECAANTGSSSIDRSTTIRVRQTANENSKYGTTSVSQAKQPAANQVTIKVSYGVAQTGSNYRIHVYLPGFGTIGASTEYTYTSTSQGGSFNYTISNVTSTVTSQVQGRYDYYSNGQWVEGISLTSYPTSITVSPGGEASINLY